MRIRKGLVIGILATLLLGTIVAAIPAPGRQATPGARAVAPADAKVTIPVGNVGDELVYARFEGADPTTAIPEEEIYIVDRVEQVVDATGAQRRALVIRSNLVNENGTMANGMLRSPDTPSDPGLLTEYLDLGTRRTFRVDAQVAADGDLPYDVQEMFYAELDSVLEGVEYQGREIRAGQSLADLEPRTPPPNLRTGYSSFSAVFDPSPYADPVAGAYWSMQVFAKNASYPWDVKATPAWVATIDSEDALGVDVVIEIQVPEDVDGYAPRWIQEQRGATVRSTRTLWFTESTPYPVFEETNITTTTDGTTIVLRAYSKSLVKYEPGSSPIPWTAPLPRSASNPPRTGPIIPADGPDPGLGYPLSEAIADATLNPALAQFEAWKLQNPSAFLVSAVFMRADQPRADVPSSQWRLTWAWDGQGYVVSVERPDAGGPVVAKDHGQTPGSVERVTPADFPQNPPSLTESHAAWKLRVPSRFESRRPDYYSWGLSLGGGSCIGAPASFCPIGFVAPGGSKEDLKRIEFGVTTLGPFLLDDALAEQTAVALNTQTHATMGRYVYRVDYKEEPLNAEAEADFPTLGGAGVAGARLPTLGAAAVASGSLLALFLVAYFWPVVKFGASQLLLLPGYSKLSKSQLLEHKVRETLVEAIKQDPGAHASELARRAQVGWGTVVYHLSRLEQQGLLFSSIDGRHRRFFVAGEVQWTARDQIGVLKNEHARELYDLILEQPGVAQHELARHVGMSASNAIRHLRKLEQVGLIAREKAGRGVEYRAKTTDEGKMYDPNAAVEVT